MVLYAEWKKVHSYLDAVVDTARDQLALGNGQASDAALVTGQSLCTCSQFRIPNLWGEGMRGEMNKKS